MRKIALVYVTYDGILNRMCGVGVISEMFIQSFPKIRKYFLKNGIDINLHLITPALNNLALGYDSKLLDFSKRVAKSSGGDIHLVLNASDATEQFGSVKNWTILSGCTANKVLEISTEYQETIVYCVDPPFMRVPYYAELQKSGFSSNKIRYLLVPHSDVLSHHLENPELERLEWEASMFKFIKYNQYSYVAKTSEFLNKLLSNEYSIPNEKIISLQSGLNPDSKRYAKASDTEIKKVLIKYGIPLDKPLIFSVGRAVDYKGFDILIKAVSKLNCNYHLVMIASPYLNAPSNINSLKELIQKFSPNCTPIFNLDMELPRLICQWKNTKVIAQLSRKEPFGLLAEEVRLWARKQGPVILASNKDGYIEQIEDGKDGFLVDIASIINVTKKLEEVLSYPEVKLANIRKAGLRRFKNNYNYPKNIVKSIQDLIITF